MPDSVLWPAGSDTTWSSGDTLTFSSPNAQTVQIVYSKGTTASAVLSSANFGGVAGNFTLSLTITAAAGPGGSISPSGVISVPYGGSQAFTITPDDGYRVATVLVDGNSIAVVSTYTFSTVTSSHSIYVTFAKKPVITASAGDHGSISPTGAVIVNYSDSQTFTIIPDTGYHVVDVLVDTSSQGAITSYNFTNVLADHTISATFAINAYSITPSAGANGIISPDTVQMVNYGDSTVFTITPVNSSYRVADVLIDGVSTGPSTSYTFSNVAANHTIAASFALNTYTITAPGSTGWEYLPGWQATYYSDMAWTTVAGTRIDNEIQYANAEANTTFSLHAPTDELNWPVPMVGKFNEFSVTWDGYLLVTGSDTYTFSLTSDDASKLWIDEGLVIDHSGTSPYAPVNGTLALTPGYHHIVVKMYQQYSTAVARLQYSSSTMPLQQVTAWHTSGIVTPPGISTVNYGATPTYAITPNPGYHVADVLVNGTSVGAVTSYVFPAVTTNKTISATFAINTYTIAASSGANGVVTPAGTTTVNYGATPTYTITPNPGYHVADVLVNSTSVGAVTSYVFPAVTTNKTISATFVINTYTITPSIVNGNGTVSPATVQTVEYGNTTSTFTFVPATGYHLNTVTVNGTTMTPTGNSYTFPAVTTNKTIVGTFAINTYTITPSIVRANGTVSPATVQTVNYGDTPTFTFTPTSGYHLNIVTVNGTTVTPTGNSYTFPAVTTNKTINGTFLIDPPVANFTATPLTGGIPLEVTFTDLSTNAPTSWEWNFGYNSTSTSFLQNPTFTYPGPGNYTVRLWATNEGGTNETEKNGYIFTYVAAVADFTADTTVGPRSLNVIFNASASKGTPSSYYWEYGDPYSTTNTSLETDLETSHTYGTAGLYSVNLTVANSYSSSYLYRHDYINVTPHAPNADFFINPQDTGFAPYTVQLNAFSYGFGDPATAWDWDFNDGSAHEYTQSVSHTFTSPGSYNVSVTETNTGGTSTAYNVITVIPLTITASSGPNGNVTPAGSTVVNYGGSQTYAITPIAGYHIANVLVDSVSNGTISSYTFSNVQTNHTISATFAINQYTVTSSVTSGQGSISPLGVATYNYGATPTYTITRNATYSIGNVLVDGTSVGAVTSYTFPALTANHTISASFTKNPSVQIYYQPFTTTTGWPYDSWTRSSTSVTLSSTLRNGSSGRSVRDATTSYFGRTIPTTGYDEIYVRYAWATSGLSTTQYATAQDSTSGSYTEFARQTGNLGSLTIVNTSRPNAGNNANYALRWQIYASQAADYLYVEDVQVFGTAI